MLSPGPSVLIRLVGRPFFAAARASRFVGLLATARCDVSLDPPIPDARSRLTSQELPTMCSMIAVVETDGVRGRYTT